MMTFHSKFVNIQAAASSINQKLSEVFLESSQQNACISLLDANWITVPDHEVEEDQLMLPTVLYKASARILARPLTKLCRQSIVDRAVPLL